MSNAVNHTGTVGFAMSLLGFLTCGLLAIPAAIVCCFAIFDEDDSKPKTLAIIGLVLSAPATLLGVLFLFMVFGAAGTGMVANDLRRLEGKPAERPSTQQTPAANSEVERLKRELADQKELEKRLREFKLPDTPAPTRPGNRFSPTIDNGE